MRSLLLFILYAIIRIPLLAQEAGEVTCKVIEQGSGVPLLFATVSLYNGEELLDGTFTNLEGDFNIELSKAFTHIELSAIGYQSTLIEKLQLLKKENPCRIVLDTEPILLDEVEVKSTRSNTAYQIDRKVIHLGSDIQSSGVTALEAFDQLAEIQSDPSTGSISLRGNDNIRLLINGKSSTLNNSDLLSQISASRVDRIEIINSPSAKYMADGLSGIINVILKKEDGAGLNLTASGGVGTKRGNLGIQGNYGSDKYNVRMNASRSMRLMNSEHTIHRNFLNGNMQDIYTPHDYKGHVNSIQLGTDLFLTDKDELSMQLDYTDDYHRFYNDSEYSNLNGIADATYTRNTKHTHKTGVFNANYRRLGKREGQYIEIDYNINHNSNYYPSVDYNNGVFQLSQVINLEKQIQALSGDIVQPLSQKFKIESGASWTNSDNTSGNNLTDQNWISADYDFNYSEDLVALYSMAHATWDKLGVQMGLRYEGFSSSSINTESNLSTSLIFKDWFPSVHLKYQFDERFIFSSGYSRRITRPNLHHINVFQLGNPYFRFDGNPELSPEYSSNFEVGFQARLSSIALILHAYYYRHNDVITWTQSIEEEQLQIISFDNIGEKESWGIEADVNWDFDEKWKIQCTANYYPAILKGNDIATWNKIYSSTFSVKNSWHMGRFSADLTYRHTFKRQQINRYVDPRDRVDLALKWKLAPKRVNVSFRIVDVFNNNLFRRTTVTPDFEQFELWRFQSQTFGWLLHVDYIIFSHEARTKKKRDRKYRNNETGN